MSVEESQEIVDLRVDDDDYLQVLESNLNRSIIQHLRHKPVNRKPFVSLIKIKNKCTAEEAEAAIDLLVDKIIIFVHDKNVNWSLKHVLDSVLISDS